MTRTKTISVALVDDHPVVLRGLEGMIEAEADMAVVATARNGEEAVRRVTATNPDIVVMDVRMPSCDGVDATRRILAVHPDTRIILLSGEQSPSVVEALRAGAYGFLSKTEVTESLVQRIRDAAEGRPVIASEILGELLDTLREPHEPNPLTAREQRIVESVAQGSTNEQIAHELERSVSTVKAELATIFEKVGATDRASALAVCFRRGWLE